MNLKEDIPPWTKAISFERDRIQSRALVAVMSTALLLYSGWLSWTWSIAGPWNVLEAGWIVSICFSVLVFAMRSATAGGAAMGLLVSLDIALGTAEPDLFRSAFPALMALFLLTFAATRWRRTEKQKSGLAEDKRGRKAGQVIANLGIAALMAAIAPGYEHLHRVWLAACIAALAEATADTVSSEMGQALGGRTLLVTSGRAVSPGTDGGVSMAGTLCGLAGAVIVTAVGVMALGMQLREGLVIVVAAMIGFYVDSLLGATVERRGWLGNDLVNFSSTAVAALFALALSHFF